MKRALVCLALASCGGSSPTPSTPSNTPPSSEPAPQPTGRAKIIAHVPTGGVLELIGDRGESMEAATDAMTKHCGPSNYVITQEGDEAIGAADPTNPNRVATATVWRVHYRC